MQTGSDLRFLCGRSCAHSTKGKGSPAQLSSRHPRARQSGFCSDTAGMCSVALSKTPFHLDFILRFSKMQILVHEIAKISSGSKRPRLHDIFKNTESRK